MEKKHCMVRLSPEAFRMFNELKKIEVDGVKSKLTCNETVKRMYLLKKKVG